jgi:hypothetical protein
MKLSKALKVKNKLAGEIALAQRLINESNVTEGDNKSPHNVVELYGTLIEKQAALARLKGQIAVANGPIAYDIALMAELKARIAFLRSVPVKDGRFFSGGGYRQEPTPIDYHSALKADEIERNIASLSQQIEALQDKVDEFNATTSI